MLTPSRRPCARVTRRRVTACTAWRSSALVLTVAVLAVLLVVPAVDAASRARLAPASTSHADTDDVTGASTPGAATRRGGSHPPVASAAADGDAASRRSAASTRHNASSPVEHSRGDTVPTASSAFARESRAPTRAGSSEPPHPPSNSSAFRRESADTGAALGANRVATSDGLATASPHEEDTGIDAVIVGASPEAGASTGSRAGEEDEGSDTDLGTGGAGTSGVAHGSVTDGTASSTPPASGASSDAGLREAPSGAPAADATAGARVPPGAGEATQAGAAATAAPTTASERERVIDDGAGTGVSAEEEEEEPAAATSSASSDGSGSVGGAGSGSGVGVVDTAALEEDANASKEALSKIQQELAEAVSEVAQVLNGTQQLAEFAADDDDDVVFTDTGSDSDAESDDSGSGSGSGSGGNAADLADSGEIVAPTTPSSSSAQRQAHKGSPVPAAGDTKASDCEGSAAGGGYAVGAAGPAPRPCVSKGTEDSKRTTGTKKPDPSADSALASSTPGLHNAGVQDSESAPAPTPSAVPHAATIPHLGPRNESCHTTCRRHQLRCHAHGFREINTCEALEAAAGCEGGCLGGFGLDKPAAVNIRGHPLTLCFTLSNPTRAGQEERKLGQHKVLFDCDAKMPLSERLCPCSTIGKAKAERERLRAIIAQEQELKRKELHRLAELSDNVAMAMERMDRTHTALKATTEALSEREGQLAELVEQDRLSEEVKALSGPGTKIDYDSGVVRLKTGETLTQEEAQQKVLELSKRRHTDPEALVASKFRDPAILVIDNVLLLDVGILLLAAAFGGMAAALAGLPASLGYLVGGAVVGPSGLRLVTKWEAVGTISQFGAVFPLFSLGMQFHFTDHRRYYRASVGGTLAAAGLYTMIVVAVGLATGLMATLTEALLVAVPTSLSSPGVTVANLLDAGVLGGRSGKLSLGVLAVEDLLMCVLMSVPHTAAVGIHWADSLQAVASLALLTGVAVLVARTLRRPVMLDMFYHERNQDVFVLGLVSLCLCMSLVTGRLGLSLEMGAFVAGLTVTWMPDIKRSLASVAPLSRVFGGMFFASVGMLVSPAYVWYHAGALIRTLVVVILVKVVTMIIIMRMFRFDPVSSLTSAVALAQITEYSLMFTGKAHALGLLSRKTYLQWLSTTVTSLVVSPLLMRGLNMWIATLPAGVRDAAGGDSERHGKEGGGAESPLRRDVEYDAGSTSGAATGLYHRVARGASGSNFGQRDGHTGDAARPSSLPSPAANGGPQSSGGSGTASSSMHQDHDV